MNLDYPILNTIKTPDDVKTLDPSQIDSLCEEIRKCIINTVSVNGGHLASNLGVVELTVALHRVFSSPKDAIIFDVGHQCYTHKLMTGRFDEFHTLRKEGGMSGFMRPDESEHDPFITGHSSNSISAAYGIYKAKRIKGEDGIAIAVIGDGALTGGMAYEALNNAGGGKNNFIVILNDNKMSISRNVGALARSLTTMRNKPKYHEFKNAFSRFLLHIPFVGKHLHSVVFKLKEGIKSVVYKGNIFSMLGFNYLGPVDGHDIKALESVLNIAKGYNRPSFVHVITTKGKGYSFAELNPKNYHGVSSFDVDEGAAKSDSVIFSSVAGETLCNLAEKNDKICALTAAMTEGTGLSEFKSKFKNRFFDVGIAEQHAVTFAAGLAKEGLIPFFAVYSSFLQRAYDQIIHDCAIGGFPVKLLVDRAGIVGEDGETHQGLFDVSFLTTVPGINIYSPSCYDELRYRIKETAENNSITAIRYPRGSETEQENFDIQADFSLLAGSNNKLIITYGRIYSEACKAKKINPEINILKLNKIYPLNDEIIDIIKNYDDIYFYEEGIKNGGIAEHLSVKLFDNGFKGNYKIRAIENEFIAGSSVGSALSKHNLDYSAILKDGE